MRKKRKPFNLEDVEASRDLALILSEIQRTQDSIVLLVRGGIVLDNLLNDLLDHGLHFEISAEGFDKQYRLFFAGKCDLALAAGLLSRQEWTVLRIFNSFRNRAAHGFESYVHEDEINDLVERLKGAGWEPLPEKDAKKPLTAIDTLREILLALVGLLILSLVRTDKVPLLGGDLDSKHWMKASLLGIVVAIFTISRERLIRDSKEKGHAIVQEVSESLKDHKWSTMPPSDDEVLSVMNSRLQERPMRAEEISQPIIKALEPLLERAGIYLLIDPDLKSITLTNQIQNHPTEGRGELRITGHKANEGRVSDAST